MNGNKGARLPFRLDHPSVFSLWEDSLVRLRQTFIINARSVGNFAILDVIHITYNAVKQKRKADSSISDSVPPHSGHLYVQLGITVGLGLRIVVSVTKSSRISLDPSKVTTPQVSQQELHGVVYGFTCLPSRPGPKQVKENRPIVSSPFFPSLPSLFSILSLSFLSRPSNLFSGLGSPVGALWGGGNMELGKHQGSHCRDYNTHISLWQLPFQRMTSRQDPVRAGIQWHFLSPLCNTDSTYRHRFHNIVSVYGDTVSAYSQPTS